MTVIAAIFPMRFAQQPCNRCGVPLDIEGGISDHDAEGRLIGFHHAGECPA